MLSVVDGCSLSSIILTGLLIISKLDWCHVGSHKSKASIMKKHFSPGVRLNSVRILLSMAVNYAWPLHQLDVSNSFLYGDLAECVYMEQPPGYLVVGEDDKVCLLRHALYGLKQSHHAWFEKFSALLSFLLRCGDHKFFPYHLYWLCYSSCLGQ